MHYSKKKINWLHTTYSVISYQKKTLLQKRKYVQFNHLYFVVFYRFPTLSLAKL